MKLDTEFPFSSISQTPEQEVVKRNREFIISALQKLPNTKLFSFSPDPKNPNWLVVMNKNDSTEIIRLSWSTVWLLEEFPTIDFHTWWKKYSDVADGLDGVGKKFATLETRVGNIQFIQKELWKIPESKDFYFRQKSDGSLSVYIRGYAISVVNFSWSNWPIWILEDFPVIHAKSENKIAFTNQYDQYLDNPNDVWKYLAWLKEKQIQLWVIWR